MPDFIHWFFGNFGLAMFILAWVIILLSYKFSNLAFSESCFRWLVLLALGVNGLFCFIMHGFFGEFTAAAIGWQNSPFQWEVAVANLGIGLIGIFAFKASIGFRKATVLASTAWLWGDAAGHIYQMMVNHDFAAANAGSWFWIDILVPLILITCLCQIKKSYSAA